MTDNHDNHDNRDHRDNDKGAHGVTGDTVQQAAEVSKPTATVDRVVNVKGQAELVPDAQAGTDTRTNPLARGNPR